MNNRHEPFDPLQPEQLAKIERFGFSFERFGQSFPRDHRTLFFSDKGGVSQYLLSGWASPEPGHIWTIGTSAALLFDKGNHNHDPTIELDLIPFVVPGKVPHQRLTVLVNEEKVGEVVLSAPAELRFKVPRNIWERHDKVVVWFLLPDATSPKSVGLNQDQRVIALAFKRLSILD